MDLYATFSWFQSSTLGQWFSCRPVNSERWLAGQTGDATSLHQSTAAAGLSKVKGLMFLPQSKPCWQCKIKASREAYSVLPEDREKQPLFLESNHQAEQKCPAVWADLLNDSDIRIQPFYRHAKNWKSRNNNRWLLEMQHPDQLSVTPFIFILCEGAALWRQLYKPALNTSCSKSVLRTHSHSPGPAVP